MTANINEKTGIPYGVVSLNSLQDWVFEEFVNNGTNESQKYRYEEFKNDWLANNEGLDEESDEFLEEAEPDFYDTDENDEDTYTLETHDGMKLGLSTLGGAYNVWVFESPHICHTCRQCSPCCPNAGDLDSVGTYSAYTLPDDWFFDLKKCRECGKPDEYGHCDECRARR